MSENVTPFKKEHRIVRLEIKSDSMDDATGEFEGYGSIFGNVDSYNEVMAKGAFRNSLNQKKIKEIKLLWQHDYKQPIGVWENIYEDDKGLYVKGRLLIDKVKQASEAYALLKIGALDGLSIGYTVNEGGIEWSSDGSYKLITDVDLWEVSVVTFPANTRALISSVKNMDIKDIRDFENFLRDSGGFSKAEAVGIANHGFVKGLQRDADSSIEQSEDKKLSDEIQLILTALEQGVKQYYE